MRRLPEYAAHQIRPRLGVLFLPVVGDGCEISKISQVAGLAVRRIRTSFNRGDAEARRKSVGVINGIAKALLARVFLHGVEGGALGG
jgi:hypothetical protein